MIALDTNVLVRFLVKDDEDQSRRASDLIESVIRKDDTLFICDIVIAETVWVLSRCYRLSKAQIVSTIKKLLVARNLTFQASHRVAAALRSYQKGSAGFADYLIREQALESNCEKIATFDRALLDESGFIEP